MPNRHHPHLPAPPMRSRDAQAPASDLEGTSQYRCDGCGVVFASTEFFTVCTACRARRRRWDADKVSSDELADRQVEDEERGGRERGIE